MKLKPRIGVFGAASNWEPHSEDLARQIGEQLAEHEVTIVTGATSGLPLLAAKAALAKGTTVLGISPGKNAQEHVQIYKRPIEGFTEIVFTGMGFPLRNVLNAYNTDGVIALGGEVGTLQELAISVCEGKVVGLLEGSGGVTEVFKQVVGTFKKDYGSKLFSSRDPKELVVSVVSAVCSRLG